MGDNVNEMSCELIDGRIRLFNMATVESQDRETS
jgi:hypothetical protein